jgi:hypothetical protein
MLAARKVRILTGTGRAARMAGVTNARAGYKRFTVDAMRVNALRVALRRANVNACSISGPTISTG